MLIVNIDSIEPGVRLAKPIYGDNEQILLHKGTVLKKNYIERLKGLGYRFLYIHNKYVDDIEVHETISEKTRQCAIKHLKDVTADVKNSKSLKVSALKKVVSNIIDELIANKDMMLNLHNISAYDDYTFNHSVNVAVLSIMIGNFLHYPIDKLHKLGLGVLLHDVGKINVPREILNKPDKLTDDEFEVIKKHTWDGFEILRANPEICITSAHVALQHHERYNGSGYPRGLKGSDILEFARIAAIADVYDAMSSDRCYRDRLAPNEVYRILQKGAGTHFDEYILDRFIQKIALYPQGTLVKLNNGCIGVVIKQNSVEPKSPVIRIFHKGDGTELPKPIELNLLYEPELRIINVVDGYPWKGN